jgi:phosphocarrier protein
LLRRELMIRNRHGLHARPAARLMTLCRKYASTVMVFCNGRCAEGRHMMALLLLCAAMGSRIAIEVTGPDEQQALEAVATLIAEGFGER